VGGDAGLLQQVLQAAMAWVDAALPHLLPAWHHGFHHQHPEHRALLALAAAHGLAPAPAHLQALAAG